MATLIGLTGYATAGKDEFADKLVEDFDYVKVGFADALYEMALWINPEVTSVEGFGLKLSDLVETKGWTEAKRIPEVRQFLQDLGTTAREHMGVNCWVNALFPKVDKLLQSGSSVVITNCRFENEARAIKERDGALVLVERPGFGPVNDHVSDAGQCFRFADFMVSNDAGKEDLRPKAADVHEKLNLASVED